MELAISLAIWSPTHALGRGLKHQVDAIERRLEAIGDGHTTGQLGSEGLRPRAGSVDHADLPSSQLLGGQYGCSCSPSRAHHGRGAHSPGMAGQQRPGRFTQARNVGVVAVEQAILYPERVDGSDGPGDVGHPIRALSGDKLVGHGDVHAIQAASTKSVEDSLESRFIGSVQERVTALLPHRGKGCLVQRWRATVTHGVAHQGQAMGHDRQPDRYLAFAAVFVLALDFLAFLGLAGGVSRSAS